MKFFWKIFTGVFISFFIVFFLVSYANLIIQISNKEKSVINENKIIGEVVSKEIEVHSLESKWPFEILKKISENENFLFWWIAKDDSTIHLADDASFMGTNAQSYFPGIAKPADETIYLNYKQNYGLFIKRIKINEAAWFFWFSFSLKPILETKKESLLLAGISFISTVTLLGVLLYFVAGSFTKPIIRLRDSAAEIGKGNLNTDINIKSDDEISELASSFRHMSFELKKSKEKLEEKVKERTKELGQRVTELNKTKTAMLNIMADLRKANEELKEVDQTKTNFLNVVSHELKTPLTAIFAHLGVLESLNLKCAGEQEIKSLDAISRNSSYLKMLIENILEISRIEAKKFELNYEKLNMAEAINEVVENLKILSKKKSLKLITKVEKLPAVEADRERVREILSNLVSNAIKFTEKGSVTIEAVKQADSILVSIMDTGIGVPQDKISNLFKKFYQVDSSLGRKYGGTGLGLSITKQLVELQGGKIGVESIEGKGSTFYFTLPISQQKLKGGER
jgi:signal transduction histidine kinase